MNPISGAGIRKGFSLAMMGLVFCATAWADDGVQEAQGLLKERGFYSGPVNGALDADTQGALRRFQIYSGLEGSGVLNAATVEKLKASEEEAAVTPPSETRPPQETPAPAAPEPPPREAAVAPVAPPEVEAPAPSREISYAHFFRGTVYAKSSQATQRKVVMKAEERLARHRLYDGPVTGQLTEDFEEAIIRYQSRSRLTLSGRLDGATLRSLGLTAPTGAPPPPTMAPSSRAIYEGRLAKPGTPITLEP